jgi:hypothetical protein
LQIPLISPSRPLNWHVSPIALPLHAAIASWGGMFAFVEAFSLDCPRLLGCVFCFSAMLGGVSGALNAPNFAPAQNATTHTMPSANIPVKIFVAFESIGFTRAFIA